MKRAVWIWIVACLGSAIPALAQVDEREPIGLAIRSDRVSWSPEGTLAEGHVVLEVRDAAGATIATLEAERAVIEQGELERPRRVTLEGPVRGAVQRIPTDRGGAPRARSVNLEAQRALIDLEAHRLELTNAKIRAQGVVAESAEGENNVVLSGASVVVHFSADSPRVEILEARLESTPTPRDPRPERD